MLHRGCIEGENTTQNETEMSKIIEKYVLSQVQLKNTFITEAVFNTELHSRKNKCP